MIQRVCSQKERTKRASSDSAVAVSAKGKGRWKAGSRFFRDRGGAVYVEFLAVFLPVFTFFECLVQLAGIMSGKLVVQHAAVAATRAAVVVLNDTPEEFESNDEGVRKVGGARLERIELAASIPLRAHRSFIDYQVFFPTRAIDDRPGDSDDGKKEFGRDDLVRVRVTGTFRCHVPLGRKFLCSTSVLPFFIPFFSEYELQLKGEAALPNQGADYEY